MAELVLTDVSVVINSVDLSDHVKQVAIQYEAEEQDKTAMGDSGRRRLGGLKNFSVELSFNQDFAAASVDATLFPIVGSVVSIVVKPTSSAVSATNPSYSGNVLVQSYSPLDGSVGDLSEARVSLPGDGVLARNTS